MAAAPVPSFTSQSGGDPVRQIEFLVGLFEPTTDDLLAAGNYLVHERVTQTLNGVDIRGGTFAPYSPSYAKWKGQTNVDLFGKDRGTPHMLDNVEARVTKPLVLEVGIFDNEELAIRARVHNEGALIRSKGKRGSMINIPKREWLGASPDELAAMQQMIADRITARMFGGTP